MCALDNNAVGRLAVVAFIKSLTRTLHRPEYPDPGGILKVCWEMWEGARRIVKRPCGWGIP